MKNIVNIINFIRGVEPRFEVDMALPVREQIRVMKAYSLKGTFLAQYDALQNNEIVGLLKDVPSSSELGIWMEVVQPQVEACAIQWRGRYPWDWRNDVGFLIGYSLEERVKLIDKHMQKFYDIFGYLPKVAGAWHIDAFSLKYLKDKYGLDAFCICRDQIGTDGYTLQGGYYNQAYYPSVFNFFSPAQSTNNQIDVPVFRMLGSSPSFAYDFQLFDYDGLTSVPTLEPAQASMNSEWCNHLMNEIFSGNGLAFQYTQIGQENSFGWEAMKNGINFQFKKAAELANDGKVEIMTLGESGRWFKNNFKTTPSTTYVSQIPYKSNDVKSFWYESKYYRINVFIENKIAKIRDMYLFDENYREAYIDEKCTQHACEYRNLPVFDGSLYSEKNTNLKAGIYLLKKDEKIEWDDVNYSEHKNTATLVLRRNNESVTFTFNETGFTVKTNVLDFTLTPIVKKENVYGKADLNSTYANDNGNASLKYISSCEVRNNRIHFTFNDFEYSVLIEKGIPLSDFSIKPLDGDISIFLATQL